MVLFEDHNPILEQPGDLAGAGCNLGSAGGEVVEQLLSTIKQKEQELEPGVWGEVHTTRVILRGWEAGHDMKVVRSVGREQLGEKGQDLWKSLTIPDWSRTIHWR